MNEKNPPVESTEPVLRRSWRVHSTRTGLLVFAGVLLGGLLVWMMVRKAANTTLFGNAWDRSTFVFVEDVSHGRWDQLLRKYVNEQGRVRYRAWKENGEDLAELRDYLDLLSLVATDAGGRLASRIPAGNLRQNHEKAFWINAHNAMVVRGILNVFPTATVRQHTNPIGFDFNEHLKLIAAGRAWSIAEIASVQLPLFGDPRLRFAICGASADCPPLKNVAWSAASLEADLDAVAARYLNDETLVSLDADGELAVPAILEDPGSGWDWSLSGSWRGLAGLVKDPAIRNSIRDQGTAIRFVPHDWSLNDQW